jgi:hypothetical protein
MLEFCPDHTPKAFLASRSERGAYGLRDFMRGYFDAAEWLLSDETDRTRIRGWAKDAKIKIANECKAFVRFNAKLLETYCEIVGDTENYTAMERAGHDFYLSRNLHGAGFFNRGEDPCFDLLQQNALLCGEVYNDVVSGYIQEL